MNQVSQKKNRERRKTARKACFCEEIDYLIDGEIYTDSIKNISRKGVFIKTTNPLEVGKDVRMLISDFSSIRLIKVTGGVIRSKPEGTAVGFHIANPSTARHLDHYIDQL